MVDQWSGWICQLGLPPQIYRRAVPGGGDEMWLAFLGDRSEDKVEGEAGDDLWRIFLDGTVRGEHAMRPGEVCWH